MLQWYHTVISYWIVGKHLEGFSYSWVTWNWAWGQTFPLLFCSSGLFIQPDAEHAFLCRYEVFCCGDREDLPYRIDGWNTCSVQIYLQQLTLMLLCEGADMNEGQLMGDLELDSKQLEAESWSQAVDSPFLQQQNKDVVKRQDVIYGETCTDVQFSLILDGLFIYPHACISETLFHWIGITLTVIPQ